MTSFAAGLPNLPSCRAAIPPGRKCWPSQSADVSRAGPQRIFHDFLCRRAAQPAELSSCNSAGPQMLAKSGQGCFHVRGRCIFHDFLFRRAAQFAEVAQATEPSMPPVVDIDRVRARMFSQAGLPPLLPWNRRQSHHLGYLIHRCYLLLYRFLVLLRTNP